MRAYPLLISVTFLTVACGGSTSSTTSSGTTAGTGGDSTAGTTTGAGGASTTGTTTGAGGASTTAGTGGATGCSGSIDLVEDDGASIQLTSICNGSWSDGRSDAVGFIFMGGPAPGTERLQIAGCVSDAFGARGITLAVKDAMGPGDFATGTSVYTDAGGTTWGVFGDPFALKVTAFGAVGEPIEGSFQVMVTHGGDAAHNVTGTFHVCRVSDQLAP